MKKYSILIILLIMVFPGCNGFYSGQPGTPVSFSATSGVEAETDRITLTWDAVENAGVYFIYRSGTEVPVEDYEFIGNTSAVSFIDTDVEEEVHYFYRVSSGDFWGGYESAMSVPAEGCGQE